MSRSKWKGSFLKPTLIKKKIKVSIAPRNSIIPAICLGKFINLHTGKDFKKVFISKEKIGLKFGTFGYIRKVKLKTKVLHKKK
jgi:ribosomal protein S19